MKDDFFDELRSITAQTKRDLYKDLGSTQRANQAHFEAVRHQLDAAIAAARKGNYREALRLFAAMQKMLHEVKLQHEWAEILVAQAICYAKLGDKREMTNAWNRAYNLEPDNEKLKEIAIKLGLVKQS